MAVEGFFAADYGEARAKFRDAAAQAGARLETEINDAARGPAGETLATDIAWLGPADAAHVLMTVSATHGVEGFCGSGIQTGSFAGGFMTELPADTAFLAIHAINPYGFAWLRRVTEENVDLNRNFVAFDGPLPRNDGYDELADVICPAEWRAVSLAAAQARLDAYGVVHGVAALQRAVTGGQYSRPDGIFFGGAAPSWSRRTLGGIVGRCLASACRVAIIDYHTGLGPYGHGEMIVIHRQGSAAHDRARRWYGEDIVSPALGNSASSEVVGDLLSGVEAALPRVEVTGMALEYGVRAFQDTLDALRADNWLHCHGQLDSDQGREIKALMRDAFYGDAADWKEMVFDQAMDAQRRALRGLGG